MLKVGKNSPGLLNSIQQKFQFEISLIPHAQHFNFNNSKFRCTDPTQATACYCSCKQDIYKRAVLGTTILSNGEGHFGTTYQNDPGQSGPPSELVTNIPVRPNQKGPFHLINQLKFPEFWVEWKQSTALDSSLWRILRFTSRLHTAYLPNYFQLFLLKFCHTVDQFNK